MNLENNLINAINNVKQKISDAALKSGRKPEDVLLLGVTKTVDVETMQKALDLGVSHFGENRVQEYLKIRYYQERVSLAYHRKASNQ